MPIKSLNRKPVQKLVRRHRTASGARLIQHEAKGHLGDFHDLITKATTLSSNQLVDPVPFGQQMLPGAGSFNAISPQYSSEQLAKLVQNSNTLRQCIESYVVNIEGYGHTLEYVGPEGKEDGPEQQAEKIQLEGFLSACSTDKSLREIRECYRWDKETFGWGYFEIGRTAAGLIVMMDHVPAITMRRTIKDPEPVEFVTETPNPADPEIIIRKRVSRTFCRFVQRYVSGGGSYEHVYFKEFGDPRPVDPRTGRVDYSLPIEDQATEILMLQLYTPGSTYGLPRWIGQLPSILGSRESELVNLNFFRENAIPAMAVLISGGSLTAESFSVIESYLNAVKGAKAMQRIMVLEAIGDDVSGSTDHSVSAPKIDMKPMISERQQDGLFKDYDNANQEKIRSSFRLPPIYMGRAQDYTRASAFASMVTAEQQIFGPERQAFDDIMNNKILKTYRPRYWRFKSSGVPLADPDSLATMINTLDATGALTPNAVIKIANKILDIQIEPVTEDWGDYPFAVVMQYVSAGAEIKGLSKFVTDVSKLPLNQPKPDPTTNVDPIPNANKPRKKDKSKSKNTAITKADESPNGFDGVNYTFIQSLVRKEVSQIGRDLKEQMDQAFLDRANVQVPAT